jgi:hypothetical protein
MRPAIEAGLTPLVEAAALIHEVSSRLSTGNGGIQIRNNSRAAEGTPR